MPELPEVETVKETLKKQILNKKIKNTTIYYNSLIEYPGIAEFQESITNQKINDIKRRGKWLIFELDNYYLLSHLRMEGKYLIRNINDEIGKHEHISLNFYDNTTLRYQDTRKFGRMYLIKKENINDIGPLKDLGLEPWDNNLSSHYLMNKYKNKKLPIKTVLLDQSIIVGIGNIYADEILFLSNINPLKRCSDLTIEELNSIITNTRIILEQAIKYGGTTVKSYTSSEGIHGRFQQKLLVHNQTGNCKKCGTHITKIRVGGRGTYYCEQCQKM